jgi:hypothetical protein
MIRSTCNEVTYSWTVNAALSRRGIDISHEVRAVQVWTARSGEAGKVSEQRRGQAAGAELDPLAGRAELTRDLNHDGQGPRRRGSTSWREVVTANFSPGVLGERRYRRSGALSYAPWGYPHYL